MDSITVIDWEPAFITTFEEMIEEWGRRLEGVSQEAIDSLDAEKEDASNNPTKS